MTANAVSVRLSGLTSESLMPVKSAAAPSLVMRKDRVGFVLSRMVPYLMTLTSSEPVLVTAAVTLMSPIESTLFGAVNHG